MSAEWAVPWCLGGRERKIAGKIKIQLCFGLLWFAFSFLDNVLEGEGGSKEGVECVAFCRGGGEGGSKEGVECVAFCRGGNCCLSSVQVTEP